MADEHSRESGKRIVRFGVAMSLDGYIAGPNGEADWIVMDPEIDFGAIFAKFDTLVMGRGTFEAMRAMGGGPGEMPGVKVIVISRSMAPGEHPGLTVASDVAQVIADLKQRAGKDIWLFGGGKLFRSCLELGLVDALDVAVISVLLGGGVPLLPAPAPRTKLTLTNQRVYEKSGIIALEYNVDRAKTSPPGDI
jgi:dihydrofolate reductase